MARGAGLVGLFNLLQRVFDSARRLWMTATGRTVPLQDILGTIQATIDNSQGTLEALTRQYFNGQISLRQWEQAAAAEIKNAHLAQGMFARGGREMMDQRSWGRIGGTLADEYRYLRGLSEDIQAERVTVGQAVQRIRQYGNNSGQSYWREWADNMRLPESWARLPRLPRHPRDGSTICRGNCQCHLEERDDGIYWIRTAAESCDDCEEMEAGSPYRP